MTVNKEELKELFIRAIYTIQTDEASLRDFSEAITKISPESTPVVFGSGLKSANTILDLVVALTDFPRDILEWWLWDLGEKIVRIELKDRMVTYEIESPEELFEYLWEEEKINRD